MVLRTPEVRAETSDYCRAICIFQQLSQFWYDAETVETLVKVAKKVIGEKGKVALISCPTLYKQMKQECTEDNEGMWIMASFRF